MVEEEIIVFINDVPAGCVEVDVVGAKLNVCVLCIVAEELDGIVLLTTLILFQEPDLSVYWYCCPGFVFHILTVLTYIV